METIVTKCGVALTFFRGPGSAPDVTTVRSANAGAWVLHWGIRDSASAAWRLPPRDLLPERTEAVGGTAARTSLEMAEGEALTIRTGDGDRDAILEFALFNARDRQWDNNAGRNYRLALRALKAVASPSEALEAETEGRDLLDMQVGDLDGAHQVAAAAWRTADGARVAIYCDLPGAILHWGIAERARTEWKPPPAPSRPSGTEIVGDAAASTPFEERQGLGQVHLDLEPGPIGIRFVIRSRDGRWWKGPRGDFFLSVGPRRNGPIVSDPVLGPLADEIVEAEVSRVSWTLMHRFELCQELLQRVPPGHRDGLALLYVWLRFSASRQLDWQRRYNTKPRELAHAQDRLTQALALRHAHDPVGRDLVRLMLTTVGRGGEGQRVRDEILHIMHRHHIKEVAGHFMEEWHQKLHNNTTPDDVVICRAYLAFLQSGGDLGAYRQQLQDGGVSAERMRSYDRPILSEPQLVPHLRDALIHDFSEFLRVLTSVHSATDLEAAVSAALPELAPPEREALDRILYRKSTTSAEETARAVSAVRSILAGSLAEGSSGTREIVRLDVALEEFLRTTIEGTLQEHRGTNEWARLLHIVLRNLASWAGELDEVARCAAYWSRILEGNVDATRQRLIVTSALEVTESIVARRMDELDRLLQPKAEYLGTAFNAPGWAVDLFSEEVGRGRLDFIVAALARKLRESIAPAAGQSPWQVISRGRGSSTGVIRKVHSLRDPLVLRSAEAVIALCDSVAGNEEVPATVSAIVSSSSVDVLSHLAIRARNAGVLLLVSRHAAGLAQLEQRAGQAVSLHLAGGGELSIGDARAAVIVHRQTFRPQPSCPAPFAAWAFDSSSVPDGQAGGKSRHLAQLKRLVPSYVAVPDGVSVPFPVLEKVLDLEANQALSAELERAMAELEAAADTDLPVACDHMKSLVMRLSAPAELERHVRACAARIDLPLLPTWQEVFHHIKQVWASKWNDRAVLSRRSFGLPDASVRVAVLVQRIVDADYAFVIHTAHPVSGNPNELFGEVVPGLGETLVGNHPGRAASFVFDKGTSQVRWEAVLSKRHAWRGGGEVIFRSDTNAEDLPGYAGAGLYDSVPMHRYREAPLDHAAEALIWDESLAQGLASTMGALGVEVERLLGSAQDIEGAYANGRWYVVQARPQVGLLGKGAPP